MTTYQKFLDDLLQQFSERDRFLGEAAARFELADLDDDDPRREDLERLIAIYDAKAGDYDELFTHLLRASHATGNGAPAARLLELACDDERCAHTARMMLSAPHIADRAAVQEIFDRAVGLPRHWGEALEELARRPSVEKWDELFRFAPPEREYHWRRDAIARLVELGVDGDNLFRFATRHGTLPDAYRLCEEGRVAPEVVAARGEGSPIVGSWLALAALAAHANGDDLGCVRYVREARRFAQHREIRDIWIERIRERADDALRGMLDAA